jgi:hypothetical protein
MGRKCKKQTRKDPDRVGTGGPHKCVFRNLGAGTRPGGAGLTGSFPPLKLLIVVSTERVFSKRSVCPRFPE